MHQKLTCGQLNLPYENKHKITKRTKTNTDISKEMVQIIARGESLKEMKTKTKGC